MRSQKNGQGVIEYAGALVAGAMLVSVVLAAGPAEFTRLFSTILSETQLFLINMLHGQLL